MNKDIKVTGSTEPVQLARIPAFRQAFVVASFLIIAGVLLSRTVSEAFLLLPLMVGGGLLFSGTVGWCPMALILQKIPWNK